MERAGYQCLVDYNADMDHVDLSQPVSVGASDGRWVKRIQFVLIVVLGAALVVRIIYTQRADQTALRGLQTQGVAAFQSLMKHLAAKNTGALFEAGTRDVQKKHPESAWADLLRQHPELTGKWELQGSQYSSQAAGFWGRVFGIANHDALAVHAFRMKLLTGDPAGQILRIEFINESGAAKLQQLRLGERQLIGP